MNKVILRSPKFKGIVTLHYNADNQLVTFVNDAELEKVQHDWLLKALPIYRQHLDAVATKMHAVIEELPEDLSFERFWSAYDIKHNRKRCEPLWNKMNDAEKLLAILKIKSYKKYCEQTKRGVADPEKYLRDRYFETDWNYLAK